MEFNAAQLAYLILERRSRTPSPTIQSGTLVAELGKQGFAEALARRWLVPDYLGAGGLAISEEASRVHEMREAMEDPTAMDTGDEVQYVGQDGRIYVGVVRNVSADKTKTTLAFTQGRPPGYQEGLEYDTKDIKVTKKTIPDARKQGAPSPAPAAPSSSAVPPDNTYSGLSH